MGLAKRQAEADEPLTQKRHRTLTYVPAECPSKNEDPCLEEEPTPAPTDSKGLYREKANLLRPNRTQTNVGRYLQHIQHLQALRDAVSMSAWPLLWRSESSVLDWSSFSWNPIASRRSDEATSPVGYPWTEPSSAIRDAIKSLVELVPLPHSLTLSNEHLKFLEIASTGDEATISPDTASLAKKAWLEICKASNHEMPVPSACTNSDGKVFYSWDSGRYHLDLDIVPGEPAEFFFCDRETDHYWCEEYVIGTPLPGKVVRQFGLFT